MLFAQVIEDLSSAITGMYIEEDFVLASWGHHGLFAHLAKFVPLGSLLQ